MPSRVIFSHLKEAAVQPLAVWDVQFYPTHEVSVAMFQEPGYKPRYIVSSFGIPTRFEKKDGSVNPLPGRHGKTTAGEFLQRWVEHNVEAKYRLLTQFEVIILAAQRPELFHIEQLWKIRAVADGLRQDLEALSNMIREAIPDPHLGTPVQT